MSVAQDYDRMLHAVGRIPPDKARRLLRLLESDPELAEYAEQASETSEDESERPSGRLAIIGCIDGGPPDLAERSEDYLLERFNNSL